MKLNLYSTKIWLLVCLFVIQYSSFTTKGYTSIYNMDCNLGLNYGTQAEALPPPDKGIEPLKQVVWRLRLLTPDAAILDYLNNVKTIFVISLGTHNEEIEQLAIDPNYAKTWVMNNILTYPNLVFSHIVVGNEAIPGPSGNFVLQAMKNMENAITTVTGRYDIYVTTAVSYNILGASNPPSAGAFSDESMPLMKGVVEFLQTRALKYPGYALYVNVYPYFVYANNPAGIRLDYALFNTTDVVVQDGDLQYNNLFYAMLDSMIWAVEKAGGPAVDIVVSETGWPTDGNGDITTIQNAQMYVNNMIATVMKSGTPKRPEHAMKVHVYALYDENLKPEGVQSNWGVYSPNPYSEKYHVNWPEYTSHCLIGNIKLERTV